MASRLILADPPVPDHGWTSVRARANLGGHVVEAVHPAGSRPPDGMQVRA